jgi:hypothetical protein
VLPLDLIDGALVSRGVFLRAADLHQPGLHVRQRIFAGGNVDQVAKKYLKVRSQPLRASVTSAFEPPQREVEHLAVVLDDHVNVIDWPANGAQIELTAPHPLGRQAIDYVRRDDVGAANCCRSWLLELESITGRSDAPRTF